MEKLNYTWDQQFKDTETICSQIEKDKFQPNVIVGISRGGLIPGVMMSHKLNVPFKPVHASTRDFPHWENYLPRPTDKKILIVDDICDSGETFEKLSNYIKENNLSVDIEIDGGVNYETGKICRDAGANILVAGSFLFKQENLLTATNELNKFFN